ncbi:hypothetical protein thsrh120_33930 [Rhizobium sp. No.120]
MKRLRLLLANPSAPASGAMFESHQHGNLLEAIEAVDAILTEDTISSVQGSSDSQGLEAKMGIRSANMMFAKPELPPQL